MRLVLGSLTLLSVLLAGCAPTNSSTDTTTKSSTSKTAGPASSGPAAPGALTPVNTKIEWLGTKKDGQHKGSFTQFSGQISPIDKPFEQTKLSVDIETESLESDNPKLTLHLKSPDFFEVKKHPKASFVSSKIEPMKEGDNTHVITGDLTLHGTTKSISFPVKVNETADLLTLDGKLTIDRTEFGMSFDPNKVNKDVVIEISAKVARK